MSRKTTSKFLTLSAIFQKVSRLIISESEPIYGCFFTLAIARVLQLETRPFFGLLHKSSLQILFFIFFRLNRLGPISYRLSGLILNGFKRNIVFMFTWIAQTAENLNRNYSSFFTTTFFFLVFSGLTSFGLFFIGLLAVYCAFRSV